MSERHSRSCTYLHNCVPVNNRESELTLILSLLPQQTGGWDPETGAISKSAAEEMEQAFANVDACLRSAGGEGWSQVYRVNLYVTELSEDLFTAWEASAKKWTGGRHRPILTAVAVAGLALPGMRVEIEVVAHAPQQ